MASTSGEINEITVVVEPANTEEAVVTEIREAVLCMQRRLEGRTRIRSSGPDIKRGSKRVPQNLYIHHHAIGPEMVSIGPFHRAGGYPKEVREFESCKWWFLERLLLRKKKDGGSVLEDLLGAVQKLENEARSFYDEEVSMESPEFIDMMVLDGCFIIELFQQLCRNEDVDEGNPIFHSPWLIPIITRDLLKLENQLPMFVLEELFKITSTDGVRDSLTLLALKFFNLSLPRPNTESLKKASRISSIHLLGLFHNSLIYFEHEHDQLLSPFRLILAKLPPCLAFPQLPSRTRPDQSEDHLVSVTPLRYWSVSIPLFCLRWSVSAMFSCLGWSIAILRLLYNILLYCLRWSTSILAKFISLTLPNPEAYRHPVMSIQSTTQLRPAGVKFKPHRADSFLQINFRDRVLWIPPITINDLTITVFINCMAYEYLGSNRGQLFTHYIAFLSCLINSTKDVAVLCAEGIITSYSYNDHFIAGLFNKLGEKLYFDRTPGGYLGKEFLAVDAYYNSYWGTFMRTYFSTPWSFISIVSAVILLLLTGGQTVLAVLSYINKRA